jgi:hypothetical protein
VFVGIDVQDLTGDARAFARKYRINYVSLRDSGNSAYSAYGLTGVPETYYIDARGRAVAHAIGVTVSYVVGVQRVSPISEKQVSYIGRCATFATLGRAGTVGQKIFAIHNATGSGVLVDIDKLACDVSQTAASSCPSTSMKASLTRISVTRAAPGCLRRTLGSTFPNLSTVLNLPPGDAAHHRRLDHPGREWSGLDRGDDDLTLLPDPLQEGGSAVGVELGSAKTIVGIGRGLKARADLELVEDLAAATGAEVACSRPLAEGVDWVAKERYLGISGQHVAPDLYFAIGISGQIQHMVGVREAKVIVAINSDPAAPVFGECDFGIVGDLYEVVPALAAAVRALGS